MDMKGLSHLRWPFSTDGSAGREITFSVNKQDYGYIPGGVFSGTSLVLPDFPELREDHPFLWQQSEIMIWGATPYLFTVLAADKLLNP